MLSNLTRISFRQYSKEVQVLPPFLKKKIVSDKGSLVPIRESIHLASILAQGKVSLDSFITTFSEKPPKNIFEGKNDLESLIKLKTKLKPLTSDISDALIYFKCVYFILEKLDKNVQNPPYLVRNKILLHFFY